METFIGSGPPVHPVTSETKAAELPWRAGKLPKADSSLDAERCLESTRGVWPEPQPELARLDLIPHVQAREAEAFSGYLEADRLRLTWLEAEALKGLQFFHWARHTCDHVAHVQLDHFGAGPRAGVVDACAGHQAIASEPFEPEIGIRE